MYTTLNIRVTLKQNKRYPTEEIVIMYDYGPVSYELIIMMPYLRGTKGNFRLHDPEGRTSHSSA